MFEWKFIVAPLLGGVIGYITNDLAVRMLFRPHKARHLFGRRLPFTPGLIPKERERLSAAIRQVLDEDLLNAQVLEQALMSDAMLEKLDAAVNRAIDSLLAEERTVRTLLENHVSAEDLARFEKNTLEGVNGYLMDKLLASGLDATVAHVLVGELRKRLSDSSAGILTLFWDGKRTSSLEEKFTAAVRGQIEQRGPELLAGMLSSIASQGLDTPVKELSVRLDEKRPEILTTLKDAYGRLIRSALPKALATLDLGALVESKLNSLDMAELESLILRVMKKELRAIVWLGALLGALLGAINLLI